MNAELQRAVGDFVDKELLACDSSLVEDLQRLADRIPHTLGENNADGIREFSIENVENSYTVWEEGEEGTCKECDEEHVELDEDGYFCEDCFESEPKEIFEWWRVTNWFAGKLRAAGEPILDNNYGTWWGRCTTGQAILLDYVAVKIYKEVSGL